MTKKILSIIPARGGSKGLLRKNILDFLGKPLIAWTIEASLRSKYITKTVVSSDDDEILDIAEYYGADILKRPDELATDTAYMNVVVKHAVESINRQYDNMILLQPTSPLRDSKDIDHAVEKFYQLNVNSLFSACEVLQHPFDMFHVDNAKLDFFYKKDDVIKNRQEYKKVYFEDGSIYIFNTQWFKKYEVFVTSKSLIYEIKKNHAIDIDTEYDFKIAKALYLAEKVS